MNYFISALKKYAVFNGRARRAEYWNFTLFSVLISLVLAILETSSGVGEDGYLSGLFNLAILIPSIGVTVRRLHDINKSGWFILLSFIPIIGWILMIVWLLTKGDEGVNKYGPNPKTVTTTV